MAKYFWHSDEQEFKEYPPKPDTSKRSKLPFPAIRSDLEPYRNMVDGGMVDGRVEHTAFLKKHGCRVVEPGEEYQKGIPKVGGLKEELSQTFYELRDGASNG